jgi:hypothetical protein
MIYIDSLATLRQMEALQQQPAETRVFNSGMQYSQGRILIPYGEYYLALTDANVQARWRPVRQGRRAAVLDEDASLRQLYAEFADEDIALANEGLADYLRLLDDFERE